MNPFGYQYLLAKRRGIILRAMISHHQKKRRPRNFKFNLSSSSHAVESLRLRTRVVFGGMITIDDLTERYLCLKGDLQQLADI